MIPERYVARLHDVKYRNKIEFKGNILNVVFDNANINDRSLTGSNTGGIKAWTFGLYVFLLHNC